MFYTILIDEKNSSIDSNKETKSKPIDEAINIVISQSEADVKLEQRAYSASRVDYERPSSNGIVDLTYAFDSVPTIKEVEKLAKRIIKNARNRKNNFAYPRIDDVVKNAKYSGFREADSEHTKVIGQDVYHSALMVGDNPYSVQFKVDIPLETGTHNYAGHKITDIKIAPFEDVGGQITIPYKHLKDAISNISIAVLRGKVNPARYDAKNTRLYQKVYTASRVDYERASSNGIEDRKSVV